MWRFDRFVLDTQRYELRREIAPYVGLLWVGHFGESANFRRAAGEDADDLSWVAGIRAWF